MRSRAVAAVGVALVLGLGACAPEDESSSTSTPSGADACAKDKLAVKTAGTLAVGTDKPAYEPWFSNDDPANGKGYESAVTYAVAKKLGFETAEVKWQTVPFNSAFAPGPKKFDFDVNQVSISEDRRKAVDFSSGYYDVRQAVITTAGSKIANAKSVAELADAKLGAQVGTTSYTTAEELIKPKQKMAPYDTNDLAVQALKNKQLDGIVVDLPTGFYMTAAQLDDGKIVGQLPASSGQVEQFGFVLEKGSGLTGCLSQAVDALKSDGTLANLQKEYLTTQGAPELS
ncbi:amino acid ABC transporter substrate-binding protein [Kribbella capetownensis]|jgi:polar amino acid transport system substrate-binding protein|uniref:Amino acid ABC transporter substrate-binding protein n=1 Tax=Kribbella capetownensis TaxID=1572659 RepID=A0A4R0JF20_9ACTN|nr:ABC transporter substrate-binding protein [Kribbella capetownensis]TCC44727.1 amino acid ABC transporter substrate-binding protein [Kribbella capetownensis]